MLCTLNIAKSKFYITFLKIEKSLKEERTEALKIVWCDNQIAVIPANIVLEENKKYCFHARNKNNFSTPTITITYQVTSKGIELAPTIGILLDPVSVSGKTVKSKKGKMLVLNHLAERLYNRGLIVTAIHPDNILSNDQSHLSGYMYTYDPKKSIYNWRKATFPFPKVIYNQISARKWEALEISENAKQIITEKIGNRFFNSCFLDKFLSYNVLSNNSNLTKFLLDIKMYTRDNLLRMLEKYTMLYVKPISNSLGIGIWRLIKYNDGRYKLQVKKNNRVVNYCSKNIDKLIDFFDKSIGKRTYLIQQGIDLLQYEDRIYDIRALTQKNNVGNWGLTGAGVRLAAPKAFMTHVPNGGEIKNLDWILNNTITDQNKLDNIHNQFHQMAMDIPKTLENELNMHFGEISMDIGINNDYDLFLIEINAKPMKFDEVEIQQKAVDKLTEYISYLSNWDKIPD